MQEIKKLRISALEASKILGCRPYTVYHKMQIGEWDLGEAIPPDPKKGEVKWRYFIFLSKVYEKAGLDPGLALK